ncbi:adenosine deaminase [Oceanimonas smirnovii]|uniref:adenosine deaminase n=1 Tax=Oceanimonas smirnovii TaxID=264574 RepID=UPI003FD49FB7
MNSKCKLVIAVGVVISLSGCASILTDKTQRINVASNSAEKLQVQIDGRTQTAPGIITVQKENKDKTLTVITEGCEQELALNKEVEPTFFVNILSGGAFGSTTDYSSEKMWRYQDSVEIKCPQ